MLVGEWGIPNSSNKSGRDAAWTIQVKEGMTTMLRSILNKAGAGCAVLALISVTGCHGTYSEIVDPCYPERYNCKSREAVREIREVQIQNGLAAEQTMYVHYFKPGSEELNDGGVAFLSRIANRRPAPESTIYIQTAQNTYDLDYRKPEEYNSKRKELDEKRKVSVDKFLKLERPDVAFTLVTNNPGRVGINGREAAQSVRDIRRSARGYFIIPGFQDTGGAGGGGEQ